MSHMSLILTADVPSLGGMGDLVTVRGGYARNFLIPRGKGVVANETNQNELAHRRRVLDRKRKEQLKANQERWCSHGLPLAILVTLFLHLQKGFSCTRRHSQRLQHFTGLNQHCKRQCGCCNCQQERESEVEGISGWFCMAACSGFVFSQCVSFSCAGCISMMRLQVAIDCFHSC